MEIAKFSQTIEIWISALSGLDMALLLTKPDRNSWSLGQLYVHIIDESNWYNRQIEICMANEANAGRNISEKARILLERGSFENVKIKGDPIISENMRQPESAGQLKSDLEQLLQSTNAIWKRMQKVPVSGKTEHPGLGYLNCHEWLQFSEMHMRHHLKQKERIEKYLASNR